MMMNDDDDGISTNLAGNSDYANIDDDMNSYSCKFLKIHLEMEWVDPWHLL